MSDIVGTLAKGIFGRKNLLFGKMLAEWPRIAGDDMASRTAPLDLKFSKKADNNQAILHLAVQPAYATEFLYQKPVLIERLNIFFGYPAIKDIKIIQNSEVMNRKKTGAPQTRPVTLQEEQNIEGLVAGIKEDDLQTALKNWGKAILSRKKD